MTHLRWTFACTVLLPTVLGCQILLGQTQSITQEYLTVQSAGTGILDQGPTIPLPAILDPKLEVDPANLEALTDIRGGTARTTVRQTPTDFPTVANAKLASTNGNFFGFDGLNHFDQRTAGTGAFTNTNLSLEPPDQGFCVGNGYAVDAVNVAMSVYDKNTGVRMAGPTALSQLLGLHPAVIRSSPPVFGEFLSDPRCLFDSQTGRFFLTVLEIDRNPATGAFAAGSSLLIAVTQTGDPTGRWNLFRINTSAHGVGCPCFGDQPLIGTDAYGFFISTNAFPTFTSGYSGVQIYAVSKLALAAGNPPPFLLRIGFSPAIAADGAVEFSMQPATRTPGQEGGQIGSQYFMESYSIVSDLSNQLVVWSLDDTSLLTVPVGPQTHFTIQKTVVNTEVYGVPPDAMQKKGTLPLGSAVNPTVLEILATNEHRMQQVTWANGRLWAAVTTGLYSPGEKSLKAGVAWFAVNVESDSSGLRANIFRQGYVAAPNASAFFPALAISNTGNAAIGFSISGPGLFPSTGYVRLNPNTGKTGDIHIAGVGTNSEDGFTGYPSQNSTFCEADPNKPGNLLCEARWGDYGAAAVEDDGTIWLANEYIGSRSRTSLANWGTYITRLTKGND